MRLNMTVLVIDLDQEHVCWAVVGRDDSSHKQTCVTLNH